MPDFISLRIGVSCVKMRNGIEKLFFDAVRIVSFLFNRLHEKQSDHNAEKSSRAEPCKIVNAYIFTNLSTIK